MIRIWLLSSNRTFHQKLRNLKKVLVYGQHNQIMTLRQRGDDDIGKRYRGPFAS